MSDFADTAPVAVVAPVPAVVVQPAAKPPSKSITVDDFAIGAKIGRYAGTHLINQRLSSLKSAQRSIWTRVQSEKER